MCIDITLFESEVPEFLICPICKNVMDDMAFLNCKELHIFGTECIANHINKSYKCFFACDTTIYGSNYINRTPIPYYVNELNKLALKCKNNCGWTGKCNEYKLHLLACPFQEIRCKYTYNYGDTQCQLLLRKDEQEHYQICPFYHITCDICNKTEQRRFYSQNHEKIGCDLCDEKINKCMLDKHKETECSNNKVKCSCGDIIPSANIKNHKINECENRYIVCAYCHQTYMYKQKEYHDQLSDCSLCYGIRAECMISEHSKVCEGNLVACDICGLQCLRRELLHHMRNDPLTHFQALNTNINDNRQKLEDIEEKLNAIIKGVKLIAKKFNIDEIEKETDYEILLNNE